MATNPATGHPGEESSGPLVEVAELLAREIEMAELPTLVQLIKSEGQTPKEIDGRLLAKSRGRLGVNLNADQKKQVRAAFLKACEERLSSAGD